MDPLSFTASLVTLLGLVTTSSNKIYDLCKKLKNAPKNVATLLEQLRTFEGLLKELEAQLREHRHDAPPQDTLQQVWGSALVEMQRDVEGLNTIVSRVGPLLDKKSLGSKILLSARNVLSEKDIVKYQKQIEAHCGRLTTIQTIVCG